MAANRFGHVLQHLRKLNARQSAGNLEDRLLLERYVHDKDEAAFEELVARHGPMVLDLCRRVLHDPAAVDDAFQATFLVLVRKAASIRKTELLANWLYGVAYRTAAKARVEVAKRRTRESAVPSRKTVDPLDAMTLRELFAVLDEELNGLPAKYRAPLVLCYLQNRTRDEAAQQSGCSLSTLDRLLERGRALLKARMVRRGLTVGLALFPALPSQANASGGVANSLAASTMKSAAFIASGGAASSIVSPGVTILIEGVLKTMFMTKLKNATALLVIIALIGVGVIGVALHEPQAVASSQIDAQTEDKVPAAGEDEKPAAKGPVEKKTNLTTPDVRILNGHRGAVYFAAFSPNGETLVTGTKIFEAPRADEVIIWDVTAQKAKHKIQFKDPVNVWSLTLSADGKTLAVGTNVGIELRDAETGKTKHMLKGPWALSTGPCSLAFSPNCKTLAAGGSARDHIVRLWDVQTGELTGALKGHGDEVAGLSFSPDGKTLASTGGMNDTTIRFWEVATGKHRLTVNKAKEESKDGTEAVDGNWQSWPMAFSPDGKILARGRGSEVKFWDARTGEVKDRVIETLRPFNRTVQSLAFSPDGKLVAGGRDSGEIDVWETRPADGKNDWRIGDLKQTFKEHSHPVMALAFSSSGEFLASGDQDGRVRVSKMTKK